MPWRFAYIHKLTLRQASIRPFQPRSNGFVVGLRRDAVAQNARFRASNLDGVRDESLDKARDLVQDRDEVAVRASPGPAAMATGKLDKRGKPTAAVAVETIGTG